MALERSRQSHTILAHSNYDGNRRSLIASTRKKKTLSVVWTVWIASMGFCLLILNTQMPRATFRSLIEEEAMYDRPYSLAYPHLNVTGSSSSGKYNETTVPKVVPNVSRDENVFETGTSVVLEIVHKPDNSSAHAEMNHSSEENFDENGAFHKNTTSADRLDGNRTVFTNQQENDSRANPTSRWTNAVTVDDGNLQIEFFDHGRQRNKGFAACLINLEDTIRMAEWLPYHYATLPLGSVVIALDPQNSERGIQRTLELIDLWKDKIEITLWPEFVLDETKRFRKDQSYIRERQVYFANQCLAYHRSQNRTWTLLTDNDEYFIFNYVHDDENPEFDHPGVKKMAVKNTIKKHRKIYTPLRKDLPMQNESTILEYILQHDDRDENKNKKTTRFLPRCVRLPGIKYGGNLGLNKSFAGDEIIEPRFFTTLRDIHHEKRKSKFSKVMIDVSNVTSEDLEWSENNHAKTIHNPSKRVCGSNGQSDSGADYPSSLFRLNHYLGSPQSYFERSTDYRERSLDRYNEKASKVKPSKSNWDRDISSWVSAFVRSVGGATEAKKFLAPLVAYQEVSYQEMR